MIFGVDPWWINPFVIDELGFSAPKVRSSIRLRRVILPRGSVIAFGSDICCAS